MKRLVYLAILLISFSLPVFAGDTTGLQGAWLLNEASGTRSDETANSNDLTDNNTVGSVTGQFGNAADFIRSNSEYLSITDGSQTGLDLTGSFTLGFWLKTDGTSGTQNIIYKGTGSTGYRVTGGGSGTTVDFRVQGNEFISSSFTANTWTHIMVTRDSTNGKNIYIDCGTPDNEADTGAASDTSNAFAIGANSSGTDTFDGAIDEVFVFSRELNSTECSDIKDNGLESFISGGARRRMVVTM